MLLSRSRGPAGPGRRPSHAAGHTRRVAALPGPSRHVSPYGAARSARDMLGGYTWSGKTSGAFRANQGQPLRQGGAGGEAGDDGVGQLAGEAAVGVQVGIEDG